MTAGTCTVVRGCSAMAEVVGSTGVQVDSMTPRPLADVLCGLLADEPRRLRLGEMAKKRAGQFTAARMACGTFESYERSLCYSAACG